MTAKEENQMQTRVIDGPLLKRMILEAAANLDANKKTVDDLNVFPVPDGDTGTNMSLTLQYASRELEQSNDVTVSEISALASSGALMGARGNSGVILSQLLRGFAKACKGHKDMNLALAAQALKQASEMAYKAVMKPTEGTILTVARGMAEWAEVHVGEFEFMEEFLQEVISEGRRVLDKTPEMLKVLKDAGVVDAGGMGLIFIMEGTLNALTGKVSAFVPQIDWDKPVEDAIYAPEDLTYGYCTEFIILGENDETMRSALASEFETIGDSIIVVGDEQKIKVHLHTDNPDQAIAKALKIGSLTRIKIDNMREQVGARTPEPKADVPVELKKYGIIAVAAGEGMKALFLDLGVDEVVLGGQTMNPSTQDFVERLEQIPAENIIILPNNSNIILAANQSKELTQKNVVVVPTKTIPQGITALLGFDPEAQPEENLENMTTSAEQVKTGQVTYAVRDTSFNGKDINKGDIIGIFDKEIECVGSSPEEVCRQLMELMVNEDSELLSIYYGQDVSKEAAKQLLEEAEDQFENLDVELHWGGQPLYYYIVSVE